MSTKPYIVGNGYYCDEVGRYETFDAALEHYRRLTKPARYENRAIGIWNESNLDVDDSTGLTEDEWHRVQEVDERRAL